MRMCLHLVVLPEEDALAAERLEEDLERLVHRKQLEVGDVMPLLLRRPEAVGGDRIVEEGAPARHARIAVQHELGR